MGVPAEKAVNAEAAALEALGSGDHSRALTALMDLYGESLYRHCLAMVGDAALAADTHQQIFVHVYRDLPRFRGQSSLRTWLFAIARHRCLDALRARKRRRRRFETRGHLPEYGTPAQLEEATDARLRVRALTDALEELLPKTRFCVALRYLDELSYAEIGAICGDKPATVQARVSRAMPVLRRHLERVGIDGGGS